MDTDAAGSFPRRRASAIKAGGLNIFTPKSAKHAKSDISALRFLRGKNAG